MERCLRIRSIRNDFRSIKKPRYQYNNNKERPKTAQFLAANHFRNESNYKLKILLFFLLNA